MNEELVLEDKIIGSAKRVFLEKGFEKAKMQEIADTAGISRTALNYYFRTKDNLFYSIVNQIFDGLLPRFEQVLEKQNQTFSERIADLVDTYNEFLRANPDIPFFIISEINRNPRLLAGFIQNSKKINGYLSFLKKMLDTTQKPEGVNYVFQMPIEELITLFYGLLFMPYVISPMVKELYSNDGERIAEYYDHHADNVKFMLKKLIVDAN